VPFLRTIYSDRDWVFGVTVIISAAVIITAVIILIVR
jgi:hypothetical protein